MPISQSDVAFALHRISYQFDADLARGKLADVADVDSVISHPSLPNWSLRDISCEIRLGERVALIGASGAGKSTLLRLLNLSLMPVAGEIQVLGESIVPVNQRSQRRLQRQIGMIYQQLHLVDNLSVIHNVNAGNLGRWSWFKSLVSLIYPLERHAALRALEQVGIPEKINVRTDRLSGGQQQRVAIARVLIQDPLIVLADEPTASLDRSLSQDVMELLCRLCAERGRTLVVSLHDVDLARQYCDRLIGLQQGRVLFDLPTEKVSEAVLAQLYQRQPVRLRYDG